MMMMMMMMVMIVFDRNILLLKLGMIPLCHIVYSMSM